MPYIISKDLSHIDVFSFCFERGLDRHIVVILHLLQTFVVTILRDNSMPSLKQTRHPSTTQQERHEALALIEA